MPLQKREGTGVYLINCLQDDVAQNYFFLLKLSAYFGFAVSAKNLAGTENIRTCVTSATVINHSQIQGDKPQ